jgi:ElaB/YqjD/DUF883 family membrane-anchored ribosome-binding protein
MTMAMLNKVTTRATGALDQAVDAIEPAAQWLQEHGEALTAGGEKLLERTRKYVTANPLQALVLALATGYLISRISR